MASNWVCNCFLFIILILGFMTFCSQAESSEIVLIVDHRPNYNDSATTNYSIFLQSHKPGSWPGEFCKRIIEDHQTITIMCQLFQPLVFLKTDANGDQTKVVTSKMEYRGLPNIKIPPSPKIWDGRRPDKAFLDKLFSQEEFMAREERFHKKLQFAKLEYRTLADIPESKEEQLPSDMYLEEALYF